MLFFSSDTKKCFTMHFACRILWILCRRMKNIEIILKVASSGATFLFLPPWLKGGVTMAAGKKDKELEKRIQSGKITRQDVIRRLAELAFGKVNDCVQMVLDNGAIDGLDLSLLTELKRSDKGVLEIRLVDRLKALEQLAILADNRGTDLESFLQAMQGGGAQE